MDDGAPRQAQATRGHHIGEGRNVITAGLGHDGHDVFHAAVQMTRMPMILTDPHAPDNPIIFANEAFAEMTGYELDEILGRNCRFLQGTDTDRATVRRIRDAIVRREDVSEELFNYRKDGTGFWNALYISPVSDPDGNLIYFFASQIDMTKRKEAEVLLQQSQRLETLGAMASGVVHEINNLMTIVVSSLGPLRRQVQDKRGNDLLDLAQWSSLQAGKLTQQMLSFARRQYAEEGAIDLNEVVGGFDSILRHIAGTSIEVSVELAPEPLLAHLVAGQMELALLNLVRNAADAMPAGGLVTIRTAERDLDGEPAVEISVSDNGTGMPPEVARRAMEAFYTTKAKGHGTGLGLSMVHGFVGQASGRMAIESEPGTGTTVRMVFPRQAAAPDA